MSQENQTENQSSDRQSQGGRIDEQRQNGTGPRKPLTAIGIECGVCGS